MTTPGEPSDQPRGAENAPSSGAYEPPPIEQSQGQPNHAPPPPPGYQQPSGYPPPSYPPPGYTPPPSYPPPGDTGYAPPPGDTGYAPPPSYGSTPGTGYPPPSYGSTQGFPGGYSGGYQQRAATNPLAIWSLVASLIGILCGIGSIVGIVLGVMALNQIKQNRQGGHGLAVAGIIVGVASLIISLLWYMFALSR